LGCLAPEGDNAIIVCHPLTDSADADTWWSPLFGPGQVLDPRRDFIVCSNCLGSCFGTTGPASRAPDGRPWGGRFPKITVRDQVRVQMALADALGIRQIRLVIGGSLGGLQALEWLYSMPSAPRRWPVSPLRGDNLPGVLPGARRNGWRCGPMPVIEMAIMTPSPPYAGLAAARAIATLAYRSAVSLEQGYGRTVRGWLRHRGRALGERFDANSYWVLLDAMDTHDLGRGRGPYQTVLKTIRQPVLIGSIPGDGLFCPSDQQELASQIPAARLLRIESSHGNDGFLIDAEGFRANLLAYKRESTTPSIRSAPLSQYSNSGPGPCGPS